MVRIQKDSVTIEFNNLISYYTEEDNIDDLEDIGSYEEFYLKIEVDGTNVLSPILEDTINPLQEGTSFELCSGNILSLIRMIENGMKTKENQEVKFLEPNFSFELKSFSNPEKDVHYQFHIWINSGTWEGVYGGTDMGFRFRLKERELHTFLYELKELWANRKKEQLK